MCFGQLGVRIKLVNRFVYSESRRVKRFILIVFGTWRETTRRAKLPPAMMDLSAAGLALISNHLKNPCSIPKLSSILIQPLSSAFLAREQRKKARELMKYKHYPSNVPLTRKQRMQYIAHLKKQRKV